MSAVPRPVGDARQSRPTLMRTRAQATDRPRRAAEWSRADMVDFDDTDELEQEIQDHMDMNYLDNIQYADGALDECRIDFVWEDDGSE